MTEAPRRRLPIDMGLISTLLVLGRGILAIALGAAVFFNPDRSGRMIGSFIGAYWMAAGFLSLGAGFRNKDSRVMMIIVGALGVMAGLAVQTRLIWADAVAEEVLGTLLGVVALMTGILHAGGWLPVWHQLPGVRTRPGFLLGLFEIGLGLVLIFGTGVGPGARLAAVFWAFGGGVILSLEGLSMLRDRHKKPAETDEAPAPQ